MPHLLRAQAEARLKANRFAWDHFFKFRNTYLVIARDIKEAAQKATGRDPKVQIKPEARVEVVKIFILEADPNIWGLANTQLSGEQIAECYARMVVEHEN